MSKSLFSINQELLQLFEALEESGGEITPEQEQALVIGKHELAEKAEKYVHYIKSLKADIEKAKAYEEQIKAFKSRKQNALDRLEDLLLNTVKIHGKIEAGIFVIGTRKSTYLTLTNPEEISKEYRTVNIQEVFNKDKIKADLKAGKEVPGAELTENLNLAIK